MTHEELVGKTHEELVGMVENLQASLKNVNEEKEKFRKWWSEHLDNEKLLKSKLAIYKGMITNKIFVLNTEEDE